MLLPIWYSLNHIKHLYKMDLHIKFVSTLFLLAINCCWNKLRYINVLFGLQSHKLDKPKKRRKWCRTMCVFHEKAIIMAWSSFTAKYNKSFSIQPFFSFFFSKTKILWKKRWSIVFSSPISSLVYTNHLLSSNFLCFSHPMSIFSVCFFYTDSHESLFPFCRFYFALSLFGFSV